MKPRLIPLVITLALAAFAANAAADYPDKPIRLVVPFPPGGGADIAARAVGQQLQKSLGQPLIVDCRPGADGQIASAEVAKAAPDGYTLLYGSASGLSYVPATRKAPPYDPLRDFTPIASQFVVKYVLYAHPGLPVNSMRELIDYAHANPGKLSYGTGTSTAFLTMNELLASTKTNMVHVPYTGEVSAQADLLAGRIQLMFATPSSFQAHAKAGSIRALAVSDTERGASDPDVPTFAELGIPPLRVRAWLGVVGPAGLPKDVVERLSRAFNEALEVPDVRAQLDKLGFKPAGSSPLEKGALLKEQLDLMQRAVRDGHVASD